MNAEIISTLLMIVGGVTILTNIIVQVVKSITWDKIPPIWWLCLWPRH